MPEGFYNPAAVVTKTLDTSPRPWRVDNPGCEDWGVNIVDHDGARVAADLTEGDALLIVEAVNGCDDLFTLLAEHRAKINKMRDMLRRAVHIIQDRHPVEAFCGEVNMLIANGWAKKAGDEPTTEPNKGAQPKKANTCCRGKSSQRGCEFYDKGLCRGLVFLTNPPQFDPCKFEDTTAEGGAS